jgi:hypothetical protein
MASISSNIPLGATAVVVFATATSGGVPLNTALNAALAIQTLDGTTILQSAAVDGQYVPLPAGAGQVVFTNNDPTNDTTVTIVFSMDG